MLETLTLIEIHNCGRRSYAVSLPQHHVSTGALERLSVTLGL